MNSANAAGSVVPARRSVARRLDQVGAGGPSPPAPGCGRRARAPPAGRGARPAARRSARRCSRAGRSGRDRRSRSGRRGRTGPVGQRAQLVGVQVQRRPGRAALGQRATAGRYSASCCRWTTWWVTANRSPVASRQDPSQPVARSSRESARTNPRSCRATCRRRRRRRSARRRRPSAAAGRAGSGVAQRALRGHDQALRGVRGDRVRIARRARVVDDEVLGRGLLDQARGNADQAPVRVCARRCPGEEPGRPGARPRRCGRTRADCSHGASAPPHGPSDRP